jgi:hypothetical protein
MNQYSKKRIGANALVIDKLPIALPFHAHKNPNCKAKQ